MHSELHTAGSSSGGPRALSERERNAEGFAETAAQPLRRLSLIPTKNQSLKPH